MAKKGEKKSKKRLAAAKVVSILRKENTWTIRTKPGPHNKKNSIPLGVALRDLIKIAKTMKETKYILNQGAVEVDGRTVKDYGFPVGIFDIIAIKPENKTYRVLFNKKGKLVLAEEKQGSKEKLCKVVGKSAGKKGIVQVQTSDGRTFPMKKTSVKVGDSLLVSVPSQKVVKELKVEEGSSALVIAGSNVGILCTVKKVTPGTMRRPKLVELESQDKVFQTTEENIFIVGEKKPLLEVIGGHKK
ncbi:MAG: 30S ribosomal protein S4e [Candidatus Diapherotrites archaeon]|uniref:Small ribosomal subunit protein eS4 n=1 Tax=Candidatus Iainarchaeum sp. TaxID=3101447 RepID=A0A938YME6_9ARCH|nr:30S ribosomal protein S4e [Candidatus Diapherotrites archaeon]